jgi:hypothetical protein
MTNPTSKLILLATLVGLSSCAFIERGPYFHPSYSDRESRVVGRDCCGGVGPEEVLVIMGPDGVQLFLAMWNNGKEIAGSINGITGKGVFGGFTIYVPKGSIVDFQSNIIVFKNQQTESEYELKVVKSVTRDHSSRIICPNWVGYNTTSGLTPFEWTLHGKGKYGTHMWINLDTNEEFGNPEEFRVTLPSMRVNGVEFHPAPVDFSWSPGGRYLYPFNC